jgi:NitT/TauT family transport system substrate-binding protein
VDAVAIWEPHLSQAVGKGGGKLLVSTTTATNLVADVLFARADFLDKNAAVMPAFLRAWFAGAKKLKEDPEGSVPVIAKAFKQSVEETRVMLGKIKVGTFADNRAFFGLETETSPAAQLLEEAAQIWKREGVIKEIPDARKVLRTKFLDQIAADYKDERVQEDFKFARTKADASALLTKSVSIFFGTGSAELDADARRILDTFASQVIGVFQNAYVRVEGNTDNVGGAKNNKDLSQKRAQAVVDYLTTRHRFDASRFVAVGNGPDRPVADNKSPQGRELNRRTDFRIVPNY